MTKPSFCKRAAYNQPMARGGSFGVQASATSRTGPAYVPPANTFFKNQGLPTEFRAPSKGAVHTDLVSLEDIKTRWHDDAKSVLVVSDVHSNVARLHNTLMKLGLVDRAGNRVHSGTAIQIGDLVDGRDQNDEETLRYAEPLFDKVLAGNHEGAYFGGKKFDGAWFKPDLERGIGRMIQTEKMDAAFVANGVLLVHGGVTAELANGRSAEQTADDLNQTMVEFYYRNGELPDELFATSALRQGSAASGGALWADWRELLASPTEFSQVVGHSPCYLPEKAESTDIHCIDATGDRLGVALIDAEGQIHVATDNALPLL